MEKKVRVFGPASLSNLGPGFDTLGLCLESLGDIVQAEQLGHPGVSISLNECGKTAGIPLDPDKNTAGVAAQVVLSSLNVSTGVHLSIEKGFEAGSGIGSSAACATAAAWAVNLLYGGELTKEDLIEAVLAGESVASGVKHGDNVLPALLGGIVLVSSQNPTVYKRIYNDKPLWVAILLPRLKVLTKEARAILPDTVSIQTAVNQASSLGFLISALHQGAWEELGYWMMQDQLAEPVRCQLVPCFSQVKAAALENGAFGCALSGSGPAIFAITDNEQQGNQILQAMLDASLREKIQAAGYLSRVNSEGALQVN